MAGETSTDLIYPKKITHFPTSVDRQASSSFVAESIFINQQRWFFHSFGDFVLSRNSRKFKLNCRRNRSPKIHKYCLKVSFLFVSIHWHRHSYIFSRQRYMYYFFLFDFDRILIILLIYSNSLFITLSSTYYNVQSISNNNYSFSYNSTLPSIRTDFRNAPISLFWFLSQIYSFFSLLSSVSEFSRTFQERWTRLSSWC